MSDEVFCSRVCAREGGSQAGVRLLSCASPPQPRPRLRSLPMVAGLWYFSSTGHVCHDVAYRDAGIFSCPVTYKVTLCSFGHTGV